MKNTYTIQKNELIDAFEADSTDLTIYKNINDQDKKDFLETYELPNDVFYFNDIIPIAPRYERIDSPVLGETIILVLSNIQPSSAFDHIESRLESFVFVKSTDHLFWFIIDPHSTFDQDLMNEESYDINSIESIIMYVALLSYSNYVKELSYQKEQIEYLNEQTNSSTSNALLKLVTDTEQNLVLLEHTISSQEEAIRHLLENKAFIDELDNSLLVHDIQWYNNLVKKLVHVYRDLMDAVSSLYSDIIDNNLNQLMRYLTSLSIIIATVGIVAGLWGMNTGGLPFKEHPLGTFITIGIAVLAGILMSIFLKQKDFHKD